MEPREHRPNLRSLRGGERPDVPRSTKIGKGRFSAESLLGLIRSGLTKQYQRTDWDQFPPLRVSEETLSQIAAALKGSRFELLDPADRGLAAEAMPPEFQDLFGAIPVREVPCFDPNIGGQYYPTFSAESFGQELPCVSTGFLKCIHVDPKNPPRMDHVIGHDFAFKPLSKAPAWTFFINNVAAR